MTSFTQAVARREPDPLPVVDPTTGQVLDLGDAPHDQLVDVFLELEKREKAFKQWRLAVEDELVRRHGDKRAAEVVGDYEVDVDRGFTRKWDPDDLGVVLEDLITEDKLQGADIAGLLVEQPIKVDGRKAAQLLNRVEGDALVELRRCFKWEQKGRAKVKVTPVAQLVEPDYE